ncbi:TIGR04283 family arsenosugar biosynthesis glycosyltransferase [Pseudohalioglobus lutimaris]|uniref:TIGR04283 family arsenosugar biosynthesis glycosyltransferase n=1 Tax=Pseudohalioglobus lutimaris TaxID=1737061 RepID=UPI001FAF2D14|nr:TIGR04283 family arsenosugar biosynthesis glycosyltransferase [Pseudohalioglobus lutimaris]
MPTPRYSFVIPVLNEAGHIAGLLTTLRQRFPSAELVVVDGGSDDLTVQRATPLCDRLLHSPPGRALQMNRGAREAAGEYLFFLHADSIPGVDATRLAAYLERKPLWGFCRVQLSGDSWAFRVISNCINWRSRLTRVSTGDQMQFVSRKCLRCFGGFDEIPLMEDVALSKRLRRELSPLIIAEPVLTSSRRWQEKGVVKTVLQMWALRLGFALGVSPARLRRIYYDGR